MAGPLASAAPLELCSTAQEGWFEGTFSLRLSFSKGDESQKSKHGVVGAESRRRHGTGATRTDQSRVGGKCCLISLATRRGGPALSSVRHYL